MPRAYIISWMTLIENTVYMGLEVAALSFYGIDIQADVAFYNVYVRKFNNTYSINGENSLQITKKFIINIS